MQRDNKQLVKTLHSQPDVEIEQIIQELAPDTTASQMLFILEDLSTDWVEYFGSRLNIDPHFFVSHLRSSDIYEHDNDKSNAPVLPSARRRREFTSLTYFKPILLQTDCELYHGEIRDFNVMRRMTLRHEKNGDSGAYGTTIGLATRMVCYWNRFYSNGSWVGKCSPEKQNL